jgi:hypothetical protein
MQEIDVTSRFDRKGKIIPVKFELEGKEYLADGVGRRWEDEDGEHILVMAQPNNRVYELLFKSGEGIWWMVKQHGHPFRKMA